MPGEPVTLLVKYKMTNRIANNMRIILSTFPMFLIIAMKFSDFKILEDIHKDIK